MKSPYPAPSARMIQKLRECLESGSPCLAINMKSSLAALHKRGLIETKMELINGKRLLCIYVSDLGKKLLSEQK